MAVPAGTQLRYDIVGDREDLADVIYRISPEDTVFMSMIGRGKSASTFHEWQTDSLGAPDPDNAQLEGDDASFSTPAPTKRVGNYTQISTKTVATSGSALALPLAGRRSEEALQQAKRAAELKLDMETILLLNQAADAGGSDEPRKLAGLPVWLQTNVDKASDGADSGHVSGAPTATRTDGTPRPLTKDMVDNVMQSMWENGGKPKVLMVGAYNKTVVSQFEGIAKHTVDVTRAAPTFLVNAIDVYVNDFGKVRVVPNRLQRKIDAWILDPALLSVRYFRPFKVTQLGITGDNRKKQMVVEYTLRVNQEAGLGLVTDLTTAPTP